MSAKVLFIGFALGLAIVFGVYFIDHANDDNVYQMWELIGIGLFCFAFVGGILAVMLFSCSDAICGLMEYRGDKLRLSGDHVGATHWYRRCLWLQDHVLHNIWRRAQLVGKLAKSQNAENDEEADESSYPSETQPEVSRNENRSVISDAVTQSLLYRYAFVILFGMIAIGYAVNGIMNGAFMIFFVGVVLNAYWLNTAKK